MVHCIAHVKARPDRALALQELLCGLVEPTRAEAGCLHYELCRNTVDPTDFVFIERWRSDADIDAHLASPHIAAALAQLGNLLAAPLDIRRFQTQG